MQIISYIYMLQAIRIKYFIIVCCIIASSGCTKKGKTQPNVVYEGTVALDVRMVGAENTISSSPAQIFLCISSPHEWKISVKDGASFVHPEIMSGVGDMDVFLNVDENLGELRRATIIVTFGKNTEQSVVLTQLKREMSSDALKARLEIPKLSTSSDSKFVAHYAYIGDGKEVLNFCLEFIPSKHQSRWVAFRFDNETRPQIVKRQDTWSEDPNLVGLTARGTYPKFNDIKMDRGHLVASYDRVYSKQANYQTFYYSNIAPQVGERFNQSLWQTLESRVQAWGRDPNIADTLYVTKGITIEKEEDILGYIYSKENNMRVPVAKRWYMAILKVKNGKFAAIGFLLDHKEYPSSQIMPEYRISIHELQKEVGVDFFHVLPDDVEHEVESEINLKYWPGLSQ